MKLLMATLITMLMFSSSKTLAENGEIKLPIIENARVFYQDKTKLPYVANLYTHHTKAQIVSYYQSQLGEIVTQETKRGRLTLVFNQNETTYRVVISQQNSMRQVDIIAQ